MIYLDGKVFEKEEIVWLTAYCSTQPGQRKEGADECLADFKKKFSKPEPELDPLFDVDAGFQ